MDMCFGTCRNCLSQVTQHVTHSSHDVNALPFTLTVIINQNYASNTVKQWLWHDNALIRSFQELSWYTFTRDCNFIVTTKVVTLFWFQKFCKTSYLIQTVVYLYLYPGPVKCRDTSPPTTCDKSDENAVVLEMWFSHTWATSMLSKIRLILISSSENALVCPQLVDQATASFPIELSHQLQIYVVQPINWWKRLEEKLCK